jgi:hypothetical protein
VLAVQAMSSKVKDDVFIALFLAALAVGMVGARIIFGAWISDTSTATSGAGCTWQSAASS